MILEEYFLKHNPFILTTLINDLQCLHFGAKIPIPIKLKVLRILVLPPTWF